MLTKKILKWVFSLSIFLLFMTAQVHCYKNYSEQDVIFELRKLPFTADSVSISYKYNTMDWEDVWALVKDTEQNGYTITSYFCTRGTWLVYDAPRLTSAVPGDLNGTWIITTDKYDCVARSYLHHDKYWNHTFKGSIQPVTTYQKRNGDHITFFQMELFGGRSMIVDSRTKPHDRPPTYAHYINSLITVGKKSWIVQMDNVRLCFVPDQSLTVPVCYITNLVDDINTFPGGPLAVHHANGSCNSDDTLVVQLTACHENSAGIIQLNYTWPFGAPPSTGGGECTDEEDILKDEHVELIASRLNGSLGTGEWFSAIKDPKDIWKAELFDKSFQVLLKICPDSVIEKEYLLIFASLYWLHLGKIWDDGRFKNVTISELEWMEMLYDMNTCVEALSSGDYNGIATDTANEMKSYKSLSDITEKIDDMLGVKPDFDHVMEINWLMGNLVAAICSKARQFDVNFLQRFLNAYQMLYYSPVEAIWEKPEDYAEIYKYLFGGYGMEKSITKIGLCTLNAMKFSGLTEPYKRPMDQENRIFLPRSLGDENCDDNATEATPKVK